MATTVEHSTLTTDELHEPKGVSTAAAGAVYIADGAGSGDWEQQAFHIGCYLGYDAATPAYQHSVTTSDTVLNPTLTTTHANGFTLGTSPNTRITYTGTSNCHVTFIVTKSSKQSSGSNKDIETVFYKNGVAQEESREINTSSTAAWYTTTAVWDEVLSTGDYIEVFIKGSGACTLDVANMYLTAVGHAE